MTGVTPATEYVNGIKGEREEDGGNRTPARSLSLVGAAGWPQGEALATPPALVPSLPLFTGEPLDYSEPLGFNNRRISPTDNLDSFSLNPYEVNYRDLEHWQRRYVDMQNEADGYDVGVSLSLYPSGEFTAACTALGPKPQKNRKPRGQISSYDLTPMAKKLMKRAIQNHWRPFNRMYTFTFDPKLPDNVLNGDGTINHEWAHSQISRVLEAVTLKYDRLLSKVESNTGKPAKQFRFSYIRVSEIQPETGNIHFHVLADRHVDIGYLVKLWGQSSNSVQADKISGVRSLNYLFSYIKKGQSLVFGKRYAMSSELYGQLKPVKVSIKGRHARSIFLQFIQSRGATILAGRGYLGDWGFSLPPPSRQAVSSSCQRQFILELAQSLDDGGYPELMRSLTGVSPDTEIPF